MYRREGAFLESGRIKPTHAGRPRLIGSLGLTQYSFDPDGEPATQYVLTLVEFALIGTSLPAHGERRCRVAAGPEG